jgi:histidinol-phosphate aminotransferase
MGYRNLIRPEIQEMPSRYLRRGGVGIHLDANESSFPVGEFLHREILQEFSSLEFHRYPDPEATDLRKLFAETHGVSVDQVMIGNGSDELVQSLLLLFWAPSAKLMMPVPSFGMYSMLSRMVGYETREVYLDDQFDLPVEEMVAVTRREGVRLILLASPNNPTGNCFSEERIIAILEKTDAVVVVDEAYAPFSRQNFIKLLRRYENLVVLRSLSPLGFAGVRIGAMFAATDLVYEATKARFPYSVNVFSQCASAVLLRHPHELERQVAQITAGRASLAAAMREIRGVTVYPSDSNMILFKVTAGGEALHRKLQEARIYVSNLSKPGRLYNSFRVTVGTEDENRQFVDALAKAYT